MQKSQATREQAREMGVSIREAEHQLDAEFFLDEYPRWDIEGPHHPIILHSMFLHADGEGWEEAERFICWGCWQSLPRLDPEENLSAIWMVGYQTSWKEIWDLYHEVYLLRRLPSPPPCGPQLREEVIQDILSLLMSHLQRWGCHPAGRGPMWCGCHHPLASLPPGSLVQVLQEKKPTWWGPPGGQGSLPVSVRSCPQTRARYCEAESRNREHPTLTLPQPQWQAPAE